MMKEPEKKCPESEYAFPSLATKKHIRQLLTDRGRVAPGRSSAG